MAVSMLKDRGRAEEVAQDIFLKFWQLLPTYDGRAKPSTWLYAIARNACLSAVRAESYRRTVPIDDATEPAAPAMAADWPLQRCLERLPEPQREIVTLFYFEDRNVGEVARMLDLPEGTVKSHLHRARRALAEMMEPDDEL